jgi:hypothetical protein
MTECGQAFWDSIHTARAKQADKPANDAKALERISESVEKLAGEVEALRRIIDRLQDDVDRALGNETLCCGKPCGEPVMPMHITSMPRDPLAPDWDERLNRFRPEDLPGLVDDGDEPKETVQRELFS